MMKLLLDTHILYWLIIDSDKLSKDARDLILNNDTIIFYSIATLWEIAIKRNRYKEEYGFSEITFEKYFKEAGYTELQIKPQHVFYLDKLVFNNDDLKHNDPFDRIMIAQAKFEEITFVTHDRILLNYGDNIRIV